MMKEKPTQAPAVVRVSRDSGVASVAHITQVALAILAAMVAFAVLFSTAVHADIQIDVNYDGGSIGPYTIDNVNDEIDFEVSSDALSYEYWTDFVVTGVLGKEVIFRITNADDVPFLKDTGHESQMVYSYDGETWHRLTDNSYSSGTYTFKQTFDFDEVRIAMFFPFSSERMSLYLDTVAATPWATKTVLGSSFEGRDIDLLEISDSTVPVTEKRVIYLIGRQHAAETASSHMLEGMIDFLISGDVNATILRRNFIWYFVPMVNPDGVYLGNSRADAEGNDPNRDWHQDNHDSIEIDIVRTSVDSINTVHGIDMFIDWHSQMNDVGWYNFVYAPYGNDFFDVLSDWTDFDAQKTPGTSCSETSCSSRGYTTGLGLFTFVFEPTPHLVTWTEETLQAEGVNTARAIGAYYVSVPIIYELGMLALVLVLLAAGVSGLSRRDRGRSSQSLD